MYQGLVPVEDLEDKDGKELIKMLTYWRKKDLVGFIPASKHTHKVSFANIIWFRILDILRDFSFPIEKMKVVADYFFKDAYFDELPKQNHLKNQAFLKAKKQKGTITKEEEWELERVEQNLTDEELLYVLRYQINYLTQFINDCLNSGEPWSILIFRDGRVGELQGDKYTTHSKELLIPWSHIL
jgi:hypothetical protein